MTPKQAAIIRALINTAKQYTDLDNVYNDKLLSSNPEYAFSWEEVETEFKEILNDRT